MKILKNVTFLLITLILVACSMPQQKPIKVNDPDSDLQNIEKKDDMFINDSTIENIFIFDTNNKNFIKKNGYTIWCEKTINNSNSFETSKVKVQKTSGNSEMGFGLIFCSTTSETENYLLTVLINIKQQYNIGKVVNGVFTSLSNGWIHSSYLNPGNLENTIEINYITSGEFNKTFQLKLNDTIISYFSDADKVTPVFNGTKSGYAVSISPNEDFEKSNVTVKFTKQ